MFEYLRLQKLRYATLHAYRSGDWRKLPIKENKNPLVEVPREITFPYYAVEMQLVKSDVLYLRCEALERVMRARAILRSQGFELKVYDGWRSMELQENLFWYYMRAFTAAKFGQGDHFEKLTEFGDIRSYFFSLPPDLQITMFDILPDTQISPVETPYHLFGAGYGDEARGDKRELHWLLYPHFPIRNSLSNDELRSIIERLVMATEERKDEILKSIERLDIILKEKSQDRIIG